MKVGHLNVTRPEWWDRSSVAVSKNYNASNVGPHAPTIRWVYTVPSLKKMFLANCMTHLIRRTAGGAGGEESWIEISVTLPTSGVSVAATARVFAPATGSLDGQVIGSGPVLYAGNIIDAVTHYNAGVGSCDFNAAMLGTEFQAN